MQMQLNVAKIRKSPTGYQKDSVIYLFNIHCVSGYNPISSISVSCP